MNGFQTTGKGWLPALAPESKQHRRAVATACLACACWAGAVSAQELILESWRKDDQILWDKVLIPAFQRLHPEIRLQFKPEEPLAYGSGWRPG